MKIFKLELEMEIFNAMGLFEIEYFNTLQLISNFAIAFLKTCAR